MNPSGAESAGPSFSIDCRGQANLSLFFIMIIGIYLIYRAQDMLEHR